MGISLELILDKDNLLKNHDSCGIDGIRISEFVEYWKNFSSY
ncbi:MAG: hypothetical protein R3Y24_05285 [Eubacteriales bacterium]